MITTVSCGLLLLLTCLLVHLSTCLLEQFIFTKQTREQLENKPKTSYFCTLVSLSLSSSCKKGFQKVLNKTSKGR